MNCKPLWNRYPQQCQAQPAYLEILESGHIQCDWNAEIGYAVPFRVWHNIDMRFAIDNSLSQKDIDALITQVMPLAERLLQKSAVEWDGHNHKRKFSDEAASLLESIHDLCEEYEPSDESEHCGDDNCDYCNWEG